MVAEEVKGLAVRAKLSFLVNAKYHGTMKWKTEREHKHIRVQIEDRCGLDNIIATGHLRRQIIRLCEKAKGF